MVGSVTEIWGERNRGIESGRGDNNLGVGGGGGGGSSGGSWFLSLSLSLPSSPAVVAVVCIQI